MKLNFIVAIISIMTNGVVLSKEKCTTTHVFSNILRLIPPEGWKLLNLFTFDVCKMFIDIHRNSFSIRWSRKTIEYEWQYDW